MRIAIVNYGCGNIGAIPNMLKRFGATATIATHPDELQGAEKIILPGVGAFGHAMECLEKGNFIDILNQKVLKDNIPILGVCLGMQLFGQSSEESTNVKGLGWINAHIKKFIATDKSIKIPHMGWNKIIGKQSDHFLLSGLDESRFYHVHSYHYDGLPSKNVLATAHHGYEFPTIIAQDNILGAQFHPEKSHRYGLQLLKNFAEY